jgi:hypothetical protein
LDLVEGRDQNTELFPREPVEPGHPRFELRVEFGWLFAAQIHERG